MKKILFKGVGSAVPTPFDENGVNISEFRKFLQFQIDNNVDALIVCGTTGESSTMTRDEKIIAINCALEFANEKIPVIVGTGSNNTREAIEMSKIAERLGADGILVVTPYYNKTTQRGLIAHYKDIAESVSLPIILYNVPSRTGVNIEPQTCLELSKIDNIVAIKEASGNISQVAQISNLCGDNLYIYNCQEGKPYGKYYRYDLLVMMTKLFLYVLLVELESFLFCQISNLNLYMIWFMIFWMGILIKLEKCN